MKYCPLKFNSKTLDADGQLRKDQCPCEEDMCALYEDFTGTCALHTLAHLRGLEIDKEDRNLEQLIN